MKLAVPFALALALVTTTAAQQPQRFVANQGQWAAAVRHRTERPAGTAWFTDTGFIVDLRPRSVTGESGVVLAFEFVGADARAPRGEQPLAGAFHYLTWRGATTDVPSFGQLRYAAVYPRIDLMVRSNTERGGLFEYDVLAAPGADLTRVRISCRGGNRLRLTADGGMVLDTACGPVVQTPPVAWEVDLGQRIPRRCHFVIFDQETFGFAVPEWSHERPLTIDPGLVRSTYFGGSGLDGINDLARDGAGVVVVGQTASSDFPVTTGAYQSTLRGPSDGFVSRFKPDGSLLFSTYLGGSGIDVLRAVALSAGDQIVVAGYSLSTDFPTTAGVVQPGAGGSGDAVVAKLSGDGKSLVFATYLGGTRYDQAQDVHVDGALAITVVGTGAAGFPTTAGAFQSAMPSTNNFYNAFVTRLTPDGQRYIYSTYLGGTNFGFARAVAVDLKGQVTVVGQTGSNNFPITAGAFQTTYQGSLGANFMAFVTRLDTAGSGLVWSTYLGGSEMDTASGIHLHDDDSVTTCGWTISSSFPVTANAYQRSYGGGGGGTTQFRGDAFVTHLNDSGTGLLASTYLGGAGMDEANGLSVDSAGNVCVIGSTGSSDFPVTPGAYRTNYLDPGFFTWVGDAWVARLDLSLSTLIHASYFGGNYTESGLGVDFDPATLTATLVGSTGSTNLPLGPGPIQTTLGGAASGFLAQLELLPTGVRRIGASSPCRRALLLEPNRTATANDPQFRLLVSGAPATAAGFLLVSSAAASAPVTLPRPLGGTLLLDSSNSILAGLSSTASGTCDIPIPLTGIPPAAKGYVQTFWANDQTCLGSDLMSSSFALELTLK